NTRLFWDGSRSSKSRSDDEDDPSAGTLSPSFLSTPSSTPDLESAAGPHTRWVFSRIGFRTLNPSDPKAETLPLGHHDLYIIKKLANAL
ncbi:hypothetical protein AVEN_139347-1, partial [Araneus ventricosus]